MALTDAKIRNAKPGEKPYKLFDAGGLYVIIAPTGSKLWRLKFRIGSKEKLLALGQYPGVTLKDAREAAEKARSIIKAGNDPTLEKRRAKARAVESAGNTFNLIAKEYLAKRDREGMAVATRTKSEWLLSLLGDIADMPVSEIQASDILLPLRRLERKGNLETARRALQFTSQVFRFAVATARLTSDPSRDLRGALTVPKVKHHAAILTADGLGELLRAIDGYQGNVSTLHALRIAPHVFVRPGELRQARWEEIDLENAVWTIPAEKTKLRRPHSVPLSKQTIDILRGADAVTGSDKGFVFPAVRTTTRPISENTLNAALRRLGYTSDQMTAHGFRATASTLLNESGKWHPDAIERALAHGDTDKVRAAYHRGAHWKERVEMAQWWSDYLDQLRTGADIISFRQAQEA